jgi:hypothetical protein
LAKTLLESNKPQQRFSRQLLTIVFRSCARLCELKENGPSLQREYDEHDNAFSRTRMKEPNMLRQQARNNISLWLDPTIARDYNSG